MKKAPSGHYLFNEFEMTGNARMLFVPHRYALWPFTGFGGMAGGFRLT